MQMILATPRDKSPDQLQLEFACRSLQIVRPGTLDQFPVQLSLAPVRRVLRRLGLTPQRPQFRAYRQNAAAVRTWIEATYPALAQRTQEQGALLLKSTRHRNRRLFLGVTRDFGDGLAIVVADNGVGFQGDAPDYLVRPFFTRKPDGIGLGLYYSNLAMELNGGRLAFPLRSEVGVPAEFDGAIVAMIFRTAG